MTHQRKILNQTSQTNQTNRTSPTNSVCSGFTMVELLVSVAVLTLLMIALGQVFSQSRQVVTRSQGRMRANNAASAITHVIRSDFRRISKLGFLHIADGGVNSDKLVFTTAGLTQSIDGDANGTGGISSYGRCANSAGGDILFRQGWVLDNDTDHTGADQYETDFAEIQQKTEPQMEAEASTIKSKAPSSLTIPPANIADVSALWQCLAKDCTSLDIAYLAHNDTNLIWQTPTATWTSHDQSTWPKAVKITFTLKDSSLSEAFSDVENYATTGVKYEIICQIE